jgi:hypothetical protein
MESSWRLTIRYGPEVRKATFYDLDEAIDAMREAAVEIVRRGPLDSASGFREYEPGERVAARLAIWTGGFLRGREAGIDIMGDGELIPYAGIVRRRPLDGRTPDRAFEAVTEALR